MGANERKGKGMERKDLEGKVKVEVTQQPHLDRRARISISSRILAKELQEIPILFFLQYKLVFLPGSIMYRHCNLATP